jgi:hypothetical protein
VSDDTPSITSRASPEWSASDRAAGAQTLVGTSERFAGPPPRVRSRDDGTPPRSRSAPETPAEEEPPRRYGVAVAVLLAVIAVAGVLAFFGAMLKT